MAHDITVFANFNTKDINDPERLYYNAPEQTYGVLNQVTESTIITINDFNDGYKLSISVNGIDGVGYYDDTFKLDDIYYKGQKVYFTTRFKTYNDFPAKHKPLMFINTALNSEGSIKPEIIDENNNILSATFESNFGELSSLTTGGFFNGYFIVHETGNNLKLKVTAHDATAPIITETSQPFHIYKEDGLYDFRKINEDNDQKANFKSYLYQPNLVNNSSFFDNFLGQIVGDANSDPNNIGIKIYEKISNFLNNSSDVDTCNINQLISQLKLLDSDVLVFAEDYPSSMKRIVDFFSMQISKIKENTNQYNFNFDSRGLTTKTKFGKNLGDEIKLNEILSGGDNWKPIVLYDKFSEQYRLLNVDPTSSFDFQFIESSNKTFCLSSYSTNWPWILILPERIGNDRFVLNEDATVNSLQDFIITEDDKRLTKEIFSYNPEEIGNFYTFYNYISTVDGSNMDSILDSTNTNTNLPLSSLSAFNTKGGILNEVLLNNFYKKTALI